MALEPPSRQDTDDVPAALHAFRAEPEARRQRPANIVSRAAALLALIRPQQLASDQYRAATEEARELLAVEPIDHSELGREELVGTLADLGEAGGQICRTHA